MSRLIDSLEAIIEAIVGRRLDYHALYPCTVASQAADRTVDLIPDDTRIKGSGQSGIKIRSGVPGFTFTVPAGTRVLLGFESGDPRRPYATLWDEGAVTETVYDGGTEDVARTGDTAGELYVQTIAGLPILWYRSDDYLAGVWTAVVVGGAAPPAAPGIGTPITIDSGNVKLKA